MKRLLLLCALPALAHDLFIIPDQFVSEPGKTITVTYHNGHFPESDVGPRPERLRDVLLVSESGRQPVEDLQLAGGKTTAKVALPAAGNHLLTVRTIPNTIELAPPKFTEYLRSEGLDWVIEWRERNGAADKPGLERYSKSVKSILQAGASSDFYSHRLGLALEMTPEKNPYTTKVGDSLPLVLLLHGKPAPDVQVEMAWLHEGKATVKVAGRTGADGRIEIPIGSPGIWKLHSVLMERRTEPGIDWESYWTSLTFEIR